MTGTTLPCPPQPAGPSSTGGSLLHANPWSDVASTISPSVDRLADAGTFVRGEAEPLPPLRAGTYVLRERPTLLRKACSKLPDFMQGRMADLENWFKERKRQRSHGNKVARAAQKVPKTHGSSRGIDPKRRIEDGRYGTLVLAQPMAAPTQFLSAEPTGQRGNRLKKKPTGYDYPDF